MDVFMKNKALYLEFNKTNHNHTESQRNATIDYLYYIRKNIDTACATKTMLAHTMIAQYSRQKVVPLVEMFQFCQHYAIDFKRMCGPDLNHFCIFLRHFPLVFKVKGDKISLRSLDLNELKNRYKAIIRRPRYLFEDGKLPKGLESSFNVTLVVDQSEGDRIAQNFYDKHPRVSIDLEGYNLGLNGIITLCQVAVSSDHVYLFDILQCPYFLKRGVLKKVLQSEKITKVLHGLSGDAANLYRQFNITLRNVYDTQAAFIGLQRKFPELRMGYDGYNLNGEWKISLNELMALYKFDTNQIKGQVKSLYRGNPNLWSYRPLCPVLLHYAGEDVNMLLRLQDAINNHPFFKPDTKETIYHTEKVIQQQVKLADAQPSSWVKPDSPRPRSVIRGKPTPMDRKDREKYTSRRNTMPNNNRSKRGVRDELFIKTQISLISKSELSPLNVGGLLSSHLNSTSLSNSSGNIDSIESSTYNPVTHPYIHNPVSSMKSSCLFVVTIGFFLIILFNRLKLWRKRSHTKISQQKKCQKEVLKTCEEKRETNKQEEI